MMEADHSGMPPRAGLQVLADRMTIINHVAGYSYLIDGELGTVVRAVLQRSSLRGPMPCSGTGPGSEKITVTKRHSMGNIHVAAQTDTTAEVRTYMPISNAPAEGGFSVFTSGTYNASLEKRGGRWTITRWYIEVDAPVPKSTIWDIPGIELIPDDRPECG